MIYLKLFWGFFQIGLVQCRRRLCCHAAHPASGGRTKQLAYHDRSLYDIIIHLQMTPGPIAINSATFVGIQIAGLPGAIIATLGCVFPSCVIVLTLAWVYFRYRNLSVVQGVLGGLRPAVVAMMLPQDFPS